MIEYGWGADYFWVSITFPNEFKEIYQQREVDIQTVIGNAGGYVGLFLGNDIPSIFERNYYKI